MGLVIGLDVGTSGCRAVAFDEQGSVQAAAEREYGVVAPRAGWAEQDPEEVWESAVCAIHEVAAGLGGTVPKAIGVSVQGEAVIPVSEEFRPLRRAILGMDGRAIAEASWLARQQEAGKLVEISGSPILATNTLAKMLWMKRNDPETWRSSRYFLLYEDFLVSRLTGRPAISQSLASRTQLCDVAGNHWWEPALRWLGVPGNRLAPIVPSGTVVGTVVPHLCAAMNLSNETVVVTGGHDQACAALGLGLVAPGMAMVSSGSAEVVVVVVDDRAVMPELLDAGVSVYRHVVPGLFLMMTLNQSAGVSLRWFAEEFCREPRDGFDGRGVSIFTDLLGDDPIEPTTVMAVSHMAGAGTPYMDPRATGSMVGLTLSTTRRDVARAIIEGITYDLRQSLEILRTNGVAVNELRATGGATKSPIWNQLRADITGDKILVPGVPYAAAWGAALIAGRAVRAFPSTPWSLLQFPAPVRIYRPERRRHWLYSRRYWLYQELAKVTHQLSAKLEEEHT